MTIWDGEGPVPNDVLVSEASAADGLLCMITDGIGPSLLDRASRLRVISQMAVGVDNIDIDECSKRGILVGHTPGILTETVADSAFALLGAAARRLFEGEREVRSGRWGPWDPFHLTGGDLHNTTIGIGAWAELTAPSPDERPVTRCVSSIRHSLPRIWPMPSMFL